MCIYIRTIFSESDIAMSLHTVALGLFCCAVLPATVYADSGPMDKCYLEQNGTKIMDGDCRIVQDSIDAMRVFDDYDENGGVFSYDNFVMAFFENDVATVYYNGGGGATHAHALIGELRLNADSGCYEGENAKFCAWYYEAPD